MKKNCERYYVRQWAKCIGWYDRGQLWLRVNYKDDERNGFSETWYENGQQSIRENYKDGKLDGLRLELYTNGQLAIRANCKDGNRDGLFESWN